MNCCTFIFMLCIGTLGVSFADKPRRCNENEEYVLEKRTCPPEICASIVSRYDCTKEPPRRPGCACKSGYLRRNKLSPCVPICQCPQIANSPECLNKNKCKDPNEEFVKEKSTCPGDTCKALVIRVDCTKAPPPKPGCVCRSGYFRINETSPCIKMCECPEMSSSPECQRQPTCSDPNEIFVQEKRSCPPQTCLSIVADYDCSNAPPPKPGCICKRDYLRLHENSPCVPACQCAELASSSECQKCSDPNEEFVEEKSTCPGDTCKALVIRVDCTKAPPPKPGCVCRSGYFRINKTSPCIKMCECPEMSSSPECQRQPTCSDPNEIFVQEKRSCPPQTCLSVVANYDCSNAPPPKPGCICKRDYLRLDENSPCVPACQCTELASSSECQKCSDPNEEFVQEKSTCPGDTCKSLVIKIDCTNAPPPQPGCVCRSGYLRSNGTCVRVSDCPEMSGNRRVSDN